MFKNTQLLPVLNNRAGLFIIINYGSKWLHLKSIENKKIKYTSFGSFPQVMSALILLLIKPLACETWCFVNSAQINIFFVCVPIRL